MKKSLLPAAIASAASLFASAAWADGPSDGYESGYDWYTTIFAGGAFGDELELTAIDGEEEFIDVFPLETGYLLGWTLGYDNVFGGGMIQLRPEAELSFRQQDVDFEAGEESISIPTDVLSVLANVWVDFELNGVTPYLGGGIGYGWADLPVEGIHVESSDMVWQFGGGLNFDVNDRIFLGVGYRYFAGDFQETIVGADFDYEYRTHEVLANLGARF